MYVIIPSETQVREFDPKLLLACHLVEQGARCIVGSRIHIHLEVNRLPRGIYIAKDVRASSDRMFRILDRLGHEIVALDEEGLLTLDSESYHAQRVSEASFKHVRTFFAWGDTHRRSMKHAPGGGDVRCLAVGNPRFDLLRPELRAFYDSEAERLRHLHGSFILINSNFGRANPAISFRRPPSADISKANLDVIDRYFAFRDELFTYFSAMVPKLAAALPEHKIVLRPHPGENFDYWRKQCADYRNIEVVHEGYIAPWLMAAKAIIHNGCTTGIEAYVLNTPCIAYRPIQNEVELELPNLVSHQAQSFDHLVSAVRSAIDGKLPPSSSNHDVEVAIRQHISALDGSFASQMIATDITTAPYGDRKWHWRTPFARVLGRAEALRRQMKKTIKAGIPGHKNSLAYTRQRFPGMTLHQVEDRIERLSKVSGRFKRIRVRQISDHIFEIFQPRTSGLGSK